MISSIRISDPTATCVPWWPAVEWLKGRETLEFTSGLNILWGPNGSGKSTVLTLLARLFHCEQAGEQKYTQTSVGKLFRSGGILSGTEMFLDGALPVHNGAAVTSFDPDRTPGLIGGAFDDDFMERGLVAAAVESKLSTGQRNVRGLGRIVMPEEPVEGLTHVLGGFEWNRLNDLWRGRMLRAEEVLATCATEKADPTRATLLLDEPDRSLALIYQGNFWRNMAMKRAADTQIIAASHSPFALFLPGVNYIETSPGYLKQCETAVRKLVEGV